MTSARIFPPTAQLAALVSIVPCVVFSHDKHPRSPAIAPPDLDPVVGTSIASSEAELVVALGLSDEKRRKKISPSHPEKPLGTGLPELYSVWISSVAYQHFGDDALQRRHLHADGF